MKTSENTRMMTHSELKDLALSRDGVRSEYDATKAEFEALKLFIKARKSAHLTQKQVAERMGTKQESVARMESKLAAGQFPSITMLKRYAAAVGKTLYLELR